LQECRALGGCATGDAKVTRGCRLPAKWIIHTVGPVWRGGQQNEDALLASDYRRSLEEAVRIGARSVAFPAISTGVYRFPPERAARIAVRTIRDFLTHHPDLRVRLIAFSEEAARTLAKALGCADK